MSQPRSTNLAVVIGTLSRVPEEVPLASGDLLVRYEVTVPHEDQRADTVPVVAVNPKHPPLSASQRVFVVGKTRRRFWSAGGATRSQVEVLAASVMPLHDGHGTNRAAVAALDDVLDHLNTEVFSQL